MKPEAQPLPRQDSRQAKAAVGRDSIRKAAWLRHLRTEASPARTPSQSRSVRITQDERPLCIDEGLIVCSVVVDGQGGRSVGELSSFVVTCPPASGAACYCTTGAARFVILRRPAFGRARIKGGMGRWLLKRARQVCRARRAKNSPCGQLDGLPAYLPESATGATSSSASGSTARCINGSQPVTSASRSTSLASAFFLGWVRRAAYSGAGK